MLATAYASQGTSAWDVILFLAVAAVGCCLYWLPTFVAHRRGVRNFGSIVVLNFFAFAGIPWVVALVMAMADPRREA